MATCSKAWICNHSFTVIAGHNPARGMDVCFLRMLFVVRQWSLCWSEDKK